MIGEQHALPGPDGPELISLLSQSRGRSLGSDTGADRDRHLCDEVLTALFAGHETLASALSWSLLLLDRHPEARERMLRELDEVLCGRMPGPEDVDALAYTSAVFKESLRLYSPSWLIFRRLTEPREVCGYVLPAGAVTLFSAWAVHHDASWWPEPDEFRPERWLAESTECPRPGKNSVGVAPCPAHFRKARPKDAFLAFGGAPRQCPGRWFAEIEGVVVLAVLNTLWRLDPVAPDLPQPRVGITLRPPERVLMVPHARRRNSELEIPREVAAHP